MITALGVLEGSVSSIPAMLFIRGDGHSVGTSRGELIRENGADGFIIVPACGRRDEGEKKLDSAGQISYMSNDGGKLIG